MDFNTFRSHLKQVAPSGVLKIGDIGKLQARTGLSSSGVRHWIAKFKKDGKIEKELKPVDLKKEASVLPDYQVQRLKEHNASLRTQLKLTNRELAVEELIRTELKSLKPLTPVKLATIPTTKGKIEEDLVMHLSDEHADQVVLPHRVGGLEEYNFRVAMARAETYVDTVLDFTMKTLSNYHFNTLWILAYGDHVSGEIHDATDDSEYRNAIRNALAVGQMHACMIRDLAPHFAQVKVVYLSGNHGRRSQKKNYRRPWDNWDYLVAETAAGVLRDQENVEFLVPDAYSANIEINGYTFNLSHGDDIKSWNSLPFYGIERQSRRLTSLHAAQGRQIHYFCRGHFHTLSTMQNPGGETLLNGSWPATDEYCYEALGAYHTPMQLIHGVHEKHGVTWRLPVYLKSENDSKGPKRYAVKLAEEDCV